MGAAPATARDADQAFAVDINERTTTRTFASCLHWEMRMLAHACACVLFCDDGSAPVTVCDVLRSSTARSCTASAVAGALGLAAATCGPSRETRMPLALVFFFADCPPVPLWSGNFFALAAGFDRGARCVAALPISKVAVGFNCQVCNVHFA